MKTSRARFILALMGFLPLLCLAQSQNHTLPPAGKMRVLFSAFDGEPKDSANKNDVSIQLLFIDITRTPNVVHIDDAIDGYTIGNLKDKSTWQIPNAILEITRKSTGEKFLLRLGRIETVARD